MQWDAVRPLVEIALAPVADVISALDSNLREELKSGLEDFLRGNRKREELTGMLREFLDTLQPLDKLEELLQISDMPIETSGMMGTQMSYIAGRSRTRAWSSYEDQRLMAGLLKYGLNNWQAVSSFVGNSRTKAQCSQRWQRGLDPKIEKTPWSPEQDSKLLSCVDQFGDKAWTRISEEVGNRSDVQCRYRYLQIKKEQEGNIGFMNKTDPVIKKANRLIPGAPLNMYIPRMGYANQMMGQYPAGMFVRNVIPDPRLNFPINMVAVYPQQRFPNQQYPTYPTQQMGFTSVVPTTPQRVGFQSMPVDNPISAPPPQQPVVPSPTNISQLNPFEQDSGSMRDGNTQIFAQWTNQMGSSSGFTSWNESV